MNGSNIIFLGGIHGVGKGTVSQYICDQLHLKYLSARKLIKWEEINEDKTNKTVRNISNTQDKLLIALSHFCEKDKNYLLDGHFCLFDSTLNPVKIDLQIFKDINPQIILVMQENVSTIQSRLKSRDSKVYNIEKIEALQKLEILHSKTVAAELNVKLFKINSNLFEVVEKLKNL